MLNAPFIGILTGVCLARVVVPKRHFVAFGAIASAVLIGAASLETLALIGGTALVVLYPIGTLIDRARASGDLRGSKRWFRVGSALVACAWILFKINREFDLPFLQGTSPSSVLLRTVGFSYFLFRAINYLYIRSLTSLPEKGPLRVLFYSLFPATLTSGPIQKYAEFCRECALPRPLDWANFSLAAFRITQGYFYKLCLAVLVKHFADQLIAHPSLTGPESLAIIVLFTLFTFFDFAGYSHIAIGFGLLLGIRVPENFKQPFLATSVTEFWRNWHVTIGDWFRDHVFIPAGAMRRGGIYAAAIAGFVMLGCGMWHGFSTLFLAWGAWHGTLLFLEGVTGSKPMAPADRHGPSYWSRILWTNMKVAMGGVFFLPSWADVGHLATGLLRWW